MKNKKSGVNIREESFLQKIAEYKADIASLTKQLADQFFLMRKLQSQNQELKFQNTKATEKVDPSAGMVVRGFIKVSSGAIRVDQIVAVLMSEDVERRSRIFLRSGQSPIDCEDLYRQVMEKIKEAQR